MKDLLQWVDEIHCQGNNCGCFRRDCKIYRSKTFENIIIERNTTQKKVLRFDFSSARCFVALLYFFPIAFSWGYTCRCNAVADEICFHKIARTILCQYNNQVLAGCVGTPAQWKQWTIWKPGFCSRCKVKMYLLLYLTKNIILFIW